MKQILQDLRSGETTVAEVPAPAARSGQVLIRSAASLISAGTERMLVDFARSNLVEKARQQPGRVRQVFDKIRTDGLLPTLEAVQSRLDTPLPLGYCNAGTVAEVGEGVSAFRPGDRVASNGPHAEFVCVPQNLCARIPDAVGNVPATFTVPGAIALEGIRLLAPSLGESVVVTGLGLIGQLAVQLLQASGCRVLGLDFAGDKLALARSFGAETVDLSRLEDPLAAAQDFARGRGVDAVLVTAATKSSKPLQQAAQMCRRRGRVVLVGVTGMELDRTPFYEKELTFQVSCSYGPGRYDPAYEEKGRDYPFGLVRWTEQRNFEAVLDALAAGRLETEPLVSHRFPLARAEEAYRVLCEPETSLGLVLEYPRAAETSPPSHRLELRPVSHPPRPQAAAVQPVLACLGAGQYAERTLLPAFAGTNCRLRYLVSPSGSGTARIGERLGFETALTEVDAAFEDPEVNTVVIATRHDSHAEYAARALRAGKNVFVEKPLAMDRPGLEAVRAAYEESESFAQPPLLMVGFNRRFAPHTLRMKELLNATGSPFAAVMTVNAGLLPADHWQVDPEVGGGRLVGEACHFVDLLRFLSGTAIEEIHAVGCGTHVEGTPPQTATLTLRFAGGSTGSIHYLANGHPSVPKERLEVFCDGRVLQLDNFRVLRGRGWRNFRSLRLWRQDKGHRACVGGFIRSLRRGEAAHIPFPELLEVARSTLEAAEELGR